MFKVNGLEINVDGMTLLNDLKLSLAQNGILLLHTIKPGVNNIQFSCPSHKDGQEHTPSCGMSTVTTYKEGKEYPSGTVHCFTCGYTATLDEFISFCFGYQDGGIFGNKWLKANYRGQLTQKTRHLELHFKETSSTLPTIPDEELDNFRYYHEYMYKRGLTDDIIDTFDVGYDSATDEITFPISNTRGEIKWILRRSVRNKFYKLPEGINKTDYLYGAYECMKGRHNKVWIVESVFNALTLWKYGIPAIALLGVGGGNQYKMLLQLPIRHYVLALDPDDAGRKASKILYDKLSKSKLISQVQYTKEGVDINDLQDEVLDLKINLKNF